MTLGKFHFAERRNADDDLGKTDAKEPKIDALRTGMVDLTPLQRRHSDAGERETSRDTCLSGLQGEG